MWHTISLPHTQHHPVYPTPQGALFQKYISSLTSDLLPVNESSSQGGGGMGGGDRALKGSLSKLSMASTGSSSSRDYVPVVHASMQGVDGRKTSAPWYARTATGGGSRSSRDVSPASVDNLSMDELDMDGPEPNEGTTLWPLTLWPLVLVFIKSARFCVCVHII